MAAGRGRGARGAGRGVRAMQVTSRAHSPPASRCAVTVRPAEVVPTPVVSTARADSLATYLRSCDFPRPGSPMMRQCDSPRVRAPAQAAAWSACATSPVALSGREPGRAGCAAGKRGVRRTGPVDSGDAAD